ncbi:hypothetical protein MJT46_018215 [Ovis ammon polii x Ovis aries]|nr:hypothetical protein MJT46_018215 [Ovis ammon polii x Ovis aries]
MPMMLLVMRVKDISQRFRENRTENVQKVLAICLLLGRGTIPLNYLFYASQSSFDASPKAVLCSHLHHQALSKLMNDEFTTHQTRSTWTAIAKVRPFRRTLLRPRSSRPKEFMGPLPSVDKTKKGTGVPGPSCVVELSVRIYLQKENRGVLSELNCVGRAACHLEPVVGWGSQRPGRADPEKTELGKRPQAAQQF